MSIINCFKVYIISHTKSTLRVCVKSNFQNKSWSRPIKHIFCVLSMKRPYNINRSLITSERTYIHGEVDFIHMSIISCGYNLLLRILHEIVAKFTLVPGILVTLFLRRGIMNNTFQKSLSFRWMKVRFYDLLILYSRFMLRTLVNLFDGSCFILKSRLHTYTRRVDLIKSICYW